MIVSIIGVGLIGGSIALDLKKAGLAKQIFGLDRSEENLQKAVELNIIDKELSLDEACQISDMIILATPVNVASDILIEILDFIKTGTIILDVGSVKGAICKAVANHQKRKQFVACHPIAGTEFSGPEAAFTGLFQGKINIICNQEESDENAVQKVKHLFEQMGSTNIFMDSSTHDKHITYVSHLSHITSFALSLTVQALEKDEKNIFNMAGSGFESTVRLAKSSADMWVPIFQANKEHMIAAIDAYINEMKRLKSFIENNENEEMQASIEQANNIRKIL